MEILTGPQAGEYTYRRDHLGSIREVIDDQGDLVARYDYDPWGVPELVSGTFDLDFRYTGRYYHAKSGLHLAPFRAYDAKLGRWLNRDPIEEEGGINLYAYVENNPINTVDPLGMFGIPTFTDSAIGHVSTVPPQFRDAYNEQRRAVDREAGQMAAETLACSAAGGGIGAGIAKALKALKLARGAKALPISSGEAKRIQNAANRIGQPVHLVGSRAQGTTRFKSDWDYVIQGMTKRQKDKIKNSLPGSAVRSDQVPRNIDFFRGPLDLKKPHMTFTPCKK